MKFIILGCGSSMGVPRSDGYFGNCDPKNKKNYRTRCSALIKKNFFINDNKNKIPVSSVKVKHGNVDSICYIINKSLAYISDVSEIYRKDFKHFKNLKYLIIDCLWLRNHPSHLNLEESLKLIKKLSPKKAILTNLHSDLDYKFLQKNLPKNVIPAYDGLSINL